MVFPKTTPDSPLRVLVIDDEKNIRATLSLCLEQIGCQVTAVSSDKNALDALNQQAYDLAFLDVRLGDASGLDLIPKLIADCPNLLVVVITAYATIDNAVEAIKRGAADYLAKPFTPAQIRHVVDQCMRQRDLKRQVTDLEGRLREAAPETDLESDSPKLRAVFEVARKAATSDAPVLLRGESGTGKSVLARWIHSLSPRSRQPFVVVNCPTLSEELLTTQGDGDYARAKELTDRLGVIGPELAEDLKKLDAAKIPVDIHFRQGLDVLGLTAPAAPDLAAPASTH